MKKITGLLLLALSMTACTSNGDVSVSLNGTPSVNVSGNISLANGQIITLPAGQNVTVIIISGNTTGNITW